MQDMKTNRIWADLSAFLQPGRLKRIVLFSGRSVLMASFAINMLSLALPLVLLQVYDRIIPYQATGTLFLLISGLAVALMLDVALKMARSHMAGWSGARFEHDAGRWAFDRLTRAPLDQVEKTPAGAHMDRLAGVSSIRDFYAGQASAAVMDAPFIVLFIAILALISGWLALIPVAAIVLAVMIARPMGEALTTALKERSESDDRRYNFLIEVLTGIHTIKSMAMEKLMLRRYEKLTERGAAIGARVTFLSGLVQNMGSTISQMTIALVAGFGSVLVVNGNLTVGGLAACTLLSGRTVQPVLRALSLWTRYKSIEVAEQQLAEFDSLPQRPVGTRALETLKAVSIQNLSFRYGEALPWVLKDLSLELNRGEIVGVTGVSGAGKSTLATLISGRMVPSSGRVLLNGHAPEDYSEESLCKAVAYIPQRPVLFRGTILENLTGFKGGDRIGRALELSRELGLEDVFARMPRGIATEVGDTAASAIPSGVAQRITIIRALLDAPSLILFDEANSALDGDSDLLLKRMMSSLRDDAAILLISHRPSLLAIADRRYVLTGGSLKPDGENQPRRDLETGSRTKTISPKQAGGAA